MAKRGRRKSKQAKPPTRINWQFGLDVPVYDIFKYYDAEMALSELIDNIESEYYLRWEAVILKEQGLSLTKVHQKALNNLLNFGDGHEDRILYIDEVPRPKEPWYETARKIATKIVDDPFRTEVGMSEAIFEDWPMLVQVLAEHGRFLSLPPNVQKPIDIFPLELRHLLQLHLCFDALSGLGQEDELTLENPEQREYRMKWFLRCLKENKAMIQFFDLSLETLFEHIIMPPKDEEILRRLMIAELDLPSEQASLAEFL